MTTRWLIISKCHVATGFSIDANSSMLPGLAGLIRREEGCDVVIISREKLISRKPADVTSVFCEEFIMRSIYFRKEFILRRHAIVASVPSRKFSRDMVVASVLEKNFSSKIC